MSENKYVNLKALSDALSYAKGYNEKTYITKVDVQTELAKKLDATAAEIHTHENKDILDGLEYTNAQIGEAITASHSHSNAEVLNGITSTKVAKWDSAEANVYREIRVNGALVPFSPKGDDSGELNEGVIDIDVPRTTEALVNNSDFQTSTGVASIFETKIASLNLGSTYQAKDDDLTAIAALSGAGLAKRNSDGTWELDNKTYAEASALHSHANKTVLDAITAENVADWSSKAAGTHNHTQAQVEGLSTALAGKVDVVDGSGLVPATKVTGYDNHLADTNVHVTETDKTNWNGKQAGSTVLTSVASQSTGTGLVKLTAGVASLDTSTYATTASIEKMQSTDNLATTWTDKTDDAHYPSTKLVSDALAGKSNSSHNHDDVYLKAETKLSKGTATGTGNAVTDISVDNHQVTLTLGKTFIETSDRITSISTSSTTNVPSEGAVKSYVDSAIAGVTGAMRFIGQISNGAYPTSNVNVGDTYKVTTTNITAEPAAKKGDTVIYSNDGWVVIPSGDDPAVTSVTAGSGLSGGTITTEGTISLATVHSEVPTAKGPSADVTGSNGATIKVPSITIDAYGRVTNLSEHTFTAVNTQVTVEDTYSGTSSNAASGKAVKAALETLDGTVTGTPAVGSTLTAFSQADGKVSATFGAIAITKSQVTDLGDVAGLSKGKLLKINAGATSATVLKTDGSSVVTNDILAGWDGRKAVENSNSGVASSADNVSSLDYCSKGQFGTVVTKNTDDTITASSTGVPTSLAVYNYASPSGHNHDGVYLKAEADPVFTASPAAGITSDDITAWNNKSNLAIGTTASTAAAGNHNHDSSYLAKNYESLDATKLNGTIPASCYTNTTYNVATSEANGLMSTEDKKKLDRIGPIDSVTVTLPPGGSWTVGVGSEAGRKYHDIQLKKGGVAFTDTSAAILMSPATNADASMWINSDMYIDSTIRVGGTMRVYISGEDVDYSDTALFPQNTVKLNLFCFS